MTKLSPNFSLAELTVTNTGLPNNPNGERLANLKRTALLMEPIRELLGNLPIIVTSGFRSSAVNIKVGGAPNSDHTLGYAVDWTCPKFGSPYLIVATIVNSGIEFDQIIHEKRKWIHISFNPKARHQVLTLPTNSNNYLTGLHK